MSTANLVNTCPACGAEEALDVLLCRMVEDDEARRLIVDVLTLSMPLGGQVARYLRLHKPIKQRLRMSKARAVLAEVVPDMRRGFITRSGREWAAPIESWKLALQAVFDAADKGTLKPPLDGNGYLYEVLMRQADRHESEAERVVEGNRRHRPAGGGLVGLTDVLEMATERQAAVDAPPRPLVIDTRPPPMSRAAREFHEREAARKQALANQSQPTDDDTKGSDQ